MRKTAILAALLLLCTLTAGAQSLLAGSYNIRNKNDGDSIRGNVWSKRCQVLCDQLNFIRPDVFGTQECLSHQLADMERQLDGYAYTGVAREDGGTTGEYAAIFYKKDRLRLLRKGDFWLSETPDRPGRGWDAACVRICSWGLFKDRQTKHRFYFFNLHMDHVGTTARREAARLVVRKIREIAGEQATVMLTGDFNVDQTNEIYQTFVQSGLLKDCYHAARLRFAENGTFNSFNTDLVSNSRIDHIFVSPALRVDNYAVLTDAYWTPPQELGESMKGQDAPQEIGFRSYERRAPSDHYPVFARLRWK